MFDTCNILRYILIKNLINFDQIWSCRLYLFIIIFLYFFFLNFWWFMHVIWRYFFDLLNLMICMTSLWFNLIFLIDFCTIILPVSLTLINYFCCLAIKWHWYFLITCIYLDLSLICYSLLYFMFHNNLRLLMCNQMYFSSIFYQLLFESLFHF